MDLRLSTAALLFLAAPLLAACGEDPVHDYSDKGTVVAPGAPGSSDKAASDGSSGSSDGLDLDKGTISRSMLSREQEQLYADMLLYREVAESTAAEKGPNAGGGSVGTFSDDPDNDHSTRKPAGIQVATGYEVAWNNGDVHSYALTTESGERMEFADGKTFVETPVPSARDKDLTAAVETLRAAMLAWSSEHGDAPSVSSYFDGVVLKTGLFADDDKDVEVELPDGISHGGYSSSGTSYEVVLESERTKESVTITGSGTSVMRSLEVV